jgi:hypothetical protein
MPPAQAKYTNEAITLIATAEFQSNYSSGASVSF